MSQAQTTEREIECGMFGPHADEIARKSMGLPEGSVIFSSSIHLNHFDDLSLRSFDDYTDDEPAEAWEVMDEVERHCYSIDVPKGLRLLGLMTPDGGRRFGLVSFTEEDDQKVSAWIEAQIQRTRGADEP